MGGGIEAVIEELVRDPDAWPPVDFLIGVPGADALDERTLRVFYLEFEIGLTQPEVSEVLKRLPTLRFTNQQGVSRLRLRALQKLRTAASRGRPPSSGSAAKTAARDG